MPSFPPPSSLLSPGSVHYSIHYTMLTNSNKEKKVEEEEREREDGEKSDCLPSTPPGVTRIYVLSQKNSWYWWDTEEPEKVVVGFTFSLEDAEAWALSSDNNKQRTYFGTFELSKETICKMKYVPGE